MTRHTVLGVDIRRPITLLLFYGAFFSCLWLWIDVGLIYHCGLANRRFPAFYWGWDFFRGFFSSPGGLSEYLGALLAQTLYYSSLGAAFLTLQAALIDWSLRAWLTRLGAPRLGWLGLGPALLLLALYCGYAHFSESITALAMVSVVARLCLALPLSRPVLRAAVMSALAVGVYMAAGRAFLIFVLPWAALELSKRSHWALKTLPILLGAVVPMALGSLVYGLTPGECWETLLPLARGPELILSRGTVLLFALYAFIPLASLFALVLARIADRRAIGAAPQAPQAAPQASAHKTPNPARRPGEKRRTTPKPGSPIPKRLTSAWGASWILKTMGVLSALTAVVFAAHDRNLRAELLTDYYCWNRQWPEALAAARPDPSNPHVACAAAQAASHTGTLLSELPRVAQPEDLLLFDEKLTGDWRKSDLYFDLGYANMALHFLTESIELYGERPILLERLATVNLALGNIPTARVFLNVLSRCPFHRRQARTSLARLDSDPTLAQDEEVQRLRTLMPRRDSVLRPRTKETLLLLLQSNRQNRMAFEYLMSYYLLSKDLQGFVQRLPLADAFAGFVPSPLWDDALALAEKRSTRPLNLRAGAVSRDAELRLKAFSRAMEACGRNNELARTTLRAEYEKTYFYYYFFHP
jgi:Family of unknown function (DUF6057)